MLDGNAVNVDVTASGAMIALSLMFLKVNFCEYVTNIMLNASLFLQNES